MKYASSRTDRIDLYWSHWPDNVTPGEEIVRGFEADLFPASHALGLGIVTWSPLGAGMLTGKYRKGEKGRAEGLGGKVFQAENSEQRTQVLDTVIAIANELGVSPGQVAIAWSGTHGSLPIIGPRSVEQLADNLAALSVELSAEQIHRLDTVSSLSASMPARDSGPLGSRSSADRGLNVGG